MLDDHVRVDDAHRRKRIPPARAAALRMRRRRDLLVELRALPDARVDRGPRHDRAHLWRCARSALLVGYAHCSTDQHDLTAQRDALLSLGVAPDRIYVGTNRERRGLREALAARRAGDTLVVTKPDRLPRPLPDARAIAAELTIREVSLSLGGSVYDATDAVRRLVFNVLAMVRRVGIRPDPARHPRGHEGRQGQGPTTRQAAQAQPSPRGPPWAPWCTAASTTPPRSTDPMAECPVSDTAARHSGAAGATTRPGFA